VSIVTADSSSTAPCSNRLSKREIPENLAKGFVQNQPQTGTTQLRSERP
jgi:hypothetical protein